MRTISLDPDFRKTPKTDNYCAICQKDIKVARLAVYLLDSFNAVHPEDAEGKGFELAEIGPECARQVPKEYLVKLS